VCCLQSDELQFLNIASANKVAISCYVDLDRVWNVMAHAQKPDFVFRRNGRVHLNRRGRQFSRLLAAEVCASAVVMLDTPWSEVVWRVLASHSIHQFPLHFPSRASPCAITFQLDSAMLCLLNCVTESIQVIEGRKYFPRRSHLASPVVTSFFFFFFFHECCTPFQSSHSVNLQYLV